jgi:peptidyl-tRNA hydrolase
MAIKQVIVVDKSLKLPRGKLAAQVAHAAVAAFLEAGPEAQQQWLAEGMPKVVLKVDNQAALVALEELARQHHLPAHLIADAGRTVVPEGAITCLGLGPADEAALDQLTGSLKLL